MGFFLIGTLWFWILFGVASCLIIFFLEDSLRYSRDNGGGTKSTFVILAALVLYYFLGSRQDVIDLFTFVKDHPFLTLARIGMYIGIGVVWSFFKWFFYLTNIKEKLLAKYKDIGKNLSEVSEYEIPSARYNKSRIITWMSYWPFSALWTLINEPFKKTFKFIYSKIEGLFQAMSDRIFKDFKKPNQ